MNDISADVNGKVTTDGTRLRSQGVGSSNDLPAGGNYTLTLPDHGNNGARNDVLYQTIEEGLRRQVSIVLLGKGAVHIHELQSFQRKTLLLKSADDITDQSSLDTIRLDHDESLLHFWV
uniref:Uncharacterized protein n=1 Tax=Opuntia streptacantha TaxID=393608 RepID=A0A7C9DLT9_OPUST